jgi:two-component system CheB/CheR fusion protein
MWVPGCATRQEAYSLAMALVEYFDDKAVRPPIQIFATDISDPAVLERARAAVYPEGIEAEVTPERLRRFFRKEDHCYRIDKAIRDMCVFARQNVTSDPPFSHVDVITCRNVLIYLSTPLQKRVLPIFHYALNTPGYLVLGTAETVGENADLFDLVDRPYKIYSKKSVPGRIHLQHTLPEDRTGIAVDGQPAGSTAPMPFDFRREADRILLGRYAPPVFWSIQTWTSSIFAAVPALTSKHRRESRRTICSRWRAKDYLSLCAMRLKRPRAKTNLSAQTE